MDNDDWDLADFLPDPQDFPRLRDYIFFMLGVILLVLGVAVAVDFLRPRRNPPRPAAHPAATAPATHPHGTPRP